MISLQKTWKGRAFSLKSFFTSSKFVQNIQILEVMSYLLSWRKKAYSLWRIQQQYTSFKFKVPFFLYSHFPLLGFLSSSFPVVYLGFVQDSPIKDCTERAHMLPFTNSFPFLPSTNESIRLNSMNAYTTISQRKHSLFRHLLAFLFIKTIRGLWKKKCLEPIMSWLLIKAATCPWRPHSVSNVQPSLP